MTERLNYRNLNLYPGIFVEPIEICIILFDQRINYFALMVQVTFIMCVCTAWDRDTETKLNRVSYFKPRTN